MTENITGNLTGEIVLLEIKEGLSVCDYISDNIHYALSDARLYVHIYTHKTHKYI